MDEQDPAALGPSNVPNYFSMFERIPKHVSMNIFPLFALPCVFKGNVSLMFLSHLYLTHQNVL